MSIRKFARCAAAAGVLVAVGAIENTAGLAATAPKTGEFDQVATISMPQVTMKTTDHVVFEGSRFRFESVDIDDNDTPYTDIYDGQSIYHYFPSEQTALRITPSDKPEDTLDSLRDQTAAKLQGSQKTGETTVNGFDCNVYTRDIGGGAKVTWYASKDPRFPYIVKMQMTNPSEGMTKTNSIENVKLDVTISSTEFTLPAGTKIVEKPTGTPSSVGPTSGESGTETK